MDRAGGRTCFSFGRIPLACGVWKLRRATAVSVSTASIQAGFQQIDRTEQKGYSCWIQESHKSPTISGTLTSEQDASFKGTLVFAAPVGVGRNPGHTLNINWVAFNFSGRYSSANPAKLLSPMEVGEPVCVEVLSDTQAVQGNPMKLTCISCISREEIEPDTRVEWYFNSAEEDTLIYLYDRQPQDLEGPWKGRLQWNGSKDLQDVSISIINATLNDTGTYTCKVMRSFTFNVFQHNYVDTKTIELVVNKEASQDFTAVYSEIMMYILLVFLTFWLLVEMIYCYRKISKADEAAQDNAD
nr:PREDICTED: sodium channel subunit beta-3 isoform X2 [Lepisosteus oculatus]